MRHCVHICACIRICINIISGVPDVNLPMDEILIEETVPGTFDGKKGSRRNIKAMPGIKGQSLSFPCNAYLNYGKDNTNTCFHLPDHCPQGVTFSTWLWLHRNMIGNENVILSSDRNTHDGVGYRIKYKAQYNVVEVKLGTKLFHQSDDICVDVGRWFHIAFTWHPTNILRVYADGCIAVHAFKNDSKLNLC